MVTRPSADELLNRVQMNSTRTEEEVQAAEKTTKSTSSLEQKGEGLFNKFTGFIREKLWPFTKALATAAVTTYATLQLLPLVAAGGLWSLGIAAATYGAAVLVTKPFGINTNKALWNGIKYVGNAFGTVLSILPPVKMALDRVLRKDRSKEGGGPAAGAPEQEQPSTFKDGSIKNKFGSTLSAEANNDNSLGFNRRTHDFRAGM